MKANSLGGYGRPVGANPFVAKPYFIFLVYRALRMISLGRQRRLGLPFVPAHAGIKRQYGLSVETVVVIAIERFHHHLHHGLWFATRHAASLGPL